MHLSIRAKSGKTAGTILAALLLTIAGHGPLRAETDGGAKSLALESISVTANKIEEDVTDVPQSITVIDECIIEEKGIKNIPDIINEIPNMSVSDNHGNSVNFRGLSASMFTQNNPVVIYIDGVPYIHRNGFDASLANVERVEVLRGPQGTLYGKDAIGAVINIVTKEASDTWQGKVGAEYGRFNTVEGQLNVSGPVLGDQLYFGANGRYQQDDGWIENDYPGMDDDPNRVNDRRIGAYLLFKPTDRLKAKINVANDYTRNYWSDGYGLPAGNDISDFDRDDAEDVSFDENTVEKIESNAQSLNLSYEFDALALTSTTTHRKLTIEGVYDADFGDEPLYAGLIQFNNSETDTWAQELRLASSKTDGFRWVGGVYFDTERHEQGPYGMQFPDFDPDTLEFIGNSEMNAESKTDSDTWAIFGQVMAPLGAGFELTLGGRYQRIEKEFDLDMYYLPIGGSGPPSFELEDEKAWTVFLPKAALSYRVTDSWTAYFSWSKGYMPGGFNYFAMEGTADDNIFEPQKSTNYELGVKGSFDRLRLAASIFRMDIEDIHVYKAVGTMYLTDNAKKAHSQGVEAEVTYLPFNSLELTLAAGFIDAEYDDYDAGVARFDGEKIDQTPSHTVRLGIAYNHPQGFYARADVRNQGRTYYYDDANKAFSKERSFTVVDLRTGYRFENWDIYAYADNLTDEKYVNAFKSNRSVALANFGEPRTFGVGARYRF
jgi:iron complex outermembrane receptor protein